MKEQLLPIGTKVFDIRFGWGKIKIASEKRDFSYYVEFENRGDPYDIKGRYLKSHAKPLLSLTEYTLENGGFTPLSDYNKPKVGDFGYFWDNYMEDQKKLIFSVIKCIADGFYYDANVTNWQNFSKEIPDWFKNKMNEKDTNK